jgi:GNAT superfamily N-acetyltransferase
MQIIDFTAAHVEQAAQIALQNYEEERGFVPALPPVDKVPDLTQFAKNNLGVAAFEGDTMLGFLCGHGVWNNAWDIPGLRNVFSPLHANGTVSENRAKIYARLYQAAGEKWAGVGAASHAVCLYAHDKQAGEQFYRYGFGIRCVDAIRGMDDITTPICDAYGFFELSPEDILDVLPLENRLDKGYIDSPFFMYRKQSNETDLLKSYERFQSVYFVAKHNGEIVAFIRAELDGEIFVQDTPGYLHCKGLYCLPEHRGKGISQNLLILLVQKLKAQGYTRLGVDFESFNPSGSGFWLKHFTAYTHSVVRRIDESAIKKQ